jgi:hypothetical protein
LCRLAPQIAPSYSRLEEMIAAHPKAADLFLDCGSWLIAVTSVCMGRPFATVANPVLSNAIKPQWQEDLRRAADDGDCAIR